MQRADSQGNTTPQTVPWNTTSNSEVGWQFSASAPASCTATYQGTITITANWVNADGTPGANPPAKFNLHLVARSSASYNTSGSGSSADGLEDTCYQVTNSYDSGSVTSAGTHTLQLSGASGSVTQTVQVTGTFTSTGGYLTPGGGIGGSLTATQDARVVGLTRVGAHGDTVDSSGTIHGDTLYSRHDTSMEVDGQVVANDYVNWQTFNAVFAGPWSGDQTWTWNPNESQDTMTMGLWEQQYGLNHACIPPDLNYWWEGQATSAQARTMTYTATDIDGYAVTCNYVLTMHDPYVALSINKGQIDGPWTDAPGALEVQNNTTKKITVPGGYIENSWSITVQIGVNIPVSDFLMGLIDGISPDFQLSVSSNTGTVAPSIDLDPGDWTILQVADVYNRTWGIAGSYDAGGYTGLVNYDYRVPFAVTLQMMPEQPMNPVPPPH